nr:hypothetical protein [Tanacetum cinerariifolium]
MQTRSSSRLTRDKTSNPTSSTNTTPKGRNRRSSKQKVKNSNLEEHLPPIVTMADNRTMAEMIRVPIKGTTSLHNEISNFQQRFDESFHEAWNRYKDLLRACPHHSFTELHQLDTFYNALNPADQDSLKAAAGVNLLERSTQDVLTIIKNKSKVRNSRNKLIVSQVKSCDVNSNSEIAKLTHVVNQQTSVITTAMTAMLKQFQATPSPASVKTSLSSQTNEIKNMMASLFQMNTDSTSGSRSLPSNTVANPKGELKAITTRSGLVTDGPTVPTSPKSITLEVDERVEETYTDPDLAEYTIKVLPHPVQKYKPPSQREFVVHKRDPLHPNIPYPSRMLRQKQQEKDEVQIQIFWQMFKQLHINITLDDALILMPNELKCKALADLGASINLMPQFVWKKLGLPKLIPTRMTLELANRAICTPVGIARDVFIPVGRFTFPANFVIVDYESDPRVLLILGRHFLRTAHALIECTTYSFSSNSLLEVFTDELDLITCPLEYDDNLQFDIESGLKEIEFLLYQDKDSSLKDSIDQKDLANLEDNFVDPIPEIFTDEHAPDYSSPSIFDVYNHFLEVESDAKNVYDDPFDSKGEKIKESKLLIDELDLPFDFLPPSEYDSFISQDFLGLMLCPQPTTRTRCQKPGHLAARLGCAEMKVATWDDLAFKLITLGWNVKH